MPTSKIIIHMHNSAFACAVCAGAYVFHQFETWQQPGLSPASSEALKLLHRLAADPGIVGILTKHRWSVGLLSEMPPEGKVGVSPVCILGVNINAGQEISLRLRTDDLKGFRRYALVPSCISALQTHLAHVESHACRCCTQLRLYINAMCANMAAVHVHCYCTAWHSVHRARTLFKVSVVKLAGIARHTAILLARCVYT